MRKATMLVLGLLLNPLTSTVAWAEIDVSYITLAEREGYDSTRAYVGRVVASRASELGFKTQGRVASVSTDIGQRVAEGQLLATLDTAELAAKLRSAQSDVALAQANIGAIEAELQLAGNTERRFRKLRDTGHAPKQTYDEAYLNLRVKHAQVTVARAQLDGAVAARDAVNVAIAEATVTAPFDGTIQARYVDEGTQVGPGQPILRIVEHGRSEAHIGVPGSVGARLTSDATYSVRWNDRTFDARLVSVLPEVDPVTRTQTAVVDLADANIPLGSPVELTLQESVAEPGYWLPLGALAQGDRGLWGVYVIDHENVISRRLVELIHTEATRVFARGTLASGDRVVDTGVHRIVPGQQVLPHQSGVAAGAR